MAERTGVLQTRLSRLASPNGAIPNLETALKLAADTVLPIPVTWWLEAPKARGKGRAA